jgi:hypothetical protein
MGGPCMMKWRLLSPSAQLMVDPASGARGIIRDTCADGAYRFHWSVIPSEESLPIAAGRTGGLAQRDRSPKKLFARMPRIGSGC